MKSKAVLGIMLTLLFIGILSSTFGIQQVEASGTIYIRADGSIEGTTDIMTVDNVTYTFTANINDEIVVERNNITIDGAGYTLQGTGIPYGIGIDLEYRSNVTIKNMEIKAFGNGISLEYSSNNNISGNNITNNEYDGIRLIWSSNNSLSRNVMNCKYNLGVFGVELGHFMHSIDVSNLVYGKPVCYLVNQKDLAINPETYPETGYLAVINSTNLLVEDLTLTNNRQGLLLAYTNNSRIINNDITNNSYDVWFVQSSNNTISGNNITKSYLGVGLCESSNNNTLSGNNIKNNEDYGVWLNVSSNNKFYHNNFINNTQQVYIDTPSYANFWDDGYPSGGNYWRDHNPPDIYSGPYQNETGRDKIGDIPYVIDGNNTDRYPLIYPYGRVPSADLNDDGIVDVYDAILLGCSYGTQPGDPPCMINWDPRADINQDGIVDIFDAIIISINFGKAV